MNNLYFMKIIIDELLMKETKIKKIEVKIIISLVIYNIINFF